MVHSSRLLRQAQLPRTVYHESIIQSMQNQTGIPLINRRIENLAVYAVLLMLATIALFVVQSVVAKGGALVLLLLFALFHTVGYRNTRTPKQLTLYFALQMLLITCLIWLSRPSDALTFLFFVLGVQAMIVLPLHWGLAWIGLFFVIDSISGITQRGSDGIIEALFNVAVYLFTALFGYAIQVAERARHRNQQLLTELQAAQGQIKELAIAEERNRLAREIHDGLGHYLTATTMQIQGAKAVLESTGASAQAPAAFSALGKAETLLQEALADVRHSVTALRITPATHNSLPETLTALAHEPQIADQLAVQFTLIGTPRALNPQVEFTLYRVAQEGLTNIHKHAQASHATLLLHYEHDQVRLTIGDDGKGTDEPTSEVTGEVTSGYGLVGLRERVQLVGGMITIQRAPGHGFQLDVVIPGQVT